MTGADFRAAGAANGSCRLFGFARIWRGGSARAGVFGWYPARPPTEPSRTMRSSSAAFCPSLTAGSGPSLRRLAQASRAWALLNHAINLRCSSTRRTYFFSTWKYSSEGLLGPCRFLCRRRRREVGPRRRVHLEDTRLARRGCALCRAPAKPSYAPVTKSARIATTSVHGPRALHPNQSMYAQQPIQLPVFNTPVADSRALSRLARRCPRVYANAEKSCVGCATRADRCSDLIRMRCPNRRPRGARCSGCFESVLFFTA